MEKVIDNLLLFIIWLAVDCFLPFVFLRWAITQTGEPYKILLGIACALASATMMWWIVLRQFFLKQIFVAFWRHLNES